MVCRIFLFLSKIHLYSLAPSQLLFQFLLSTGMSIKLLSMNFTPEILRSYLYD